MQTLIITNGDIKKTGYLASLVHENELVICADGAVRYLRDVNILPSYVVGDMDSIKKDDLEWLNKNNVPVKKYDTKKDYTDTELAIRHAIGDGGRMITMTGTMGGRMDHCMGNIYLLALIHQLEGKGRIVECDVEMMVVTSRMAMEWDAGDTVSFIPLTELVEGVCIHGFEYPLVNEILHLGHTRSLSNVVSKPKQSVSVESGMLLAVRNK